MAVDVQKYVDLGNALTGQILGTPFSHYRPVVNATTSALAPGNEVGTLYAAFDQKGGFKYRPNTKSDEWTGYFDGSQTQPGDYLTNGSRTFFIAQQQPLLPYVCVNAARVISVFRPGAMAAVDSNAYGGNTTATQVTLLTTWPASCGIGPKGEKDDITLPDEVRAPWWVIRLPQTPGVVLQSGDLITDDLIRRYTISAAESSEYGWRLTCRQNVS